MQDYMYVGCESTFHPVLYIGSATSTAALAPKTSANNSTTAVLAVHYVWRGAYFLKGIDTIRPGTHPRRVIVSCKNQVERAVRITKAFAGRDPRRDCRALLTNFQAI
jgi:hypothetical protein